MLFGFFMILLDSTIVAVANPSIMVALRTGYDTVIWVTSGYLLAYAVPLLVSGRLGDRFGTKSLYLIGLAVFTAASLACGLSGTIGMLIVARVVQGLGAGLLTPQTLSTITQTFPPERRGAALSVWGTTAGVATLVGPLAGGVLVDRLGWEWIFFVNVPIGVAGFALAVWLIPVLPTRPHRFDLLGVAFSGAGIFLIVFALQESQSAGWAPWIWALMVAGAGFLTVFVYWQSINTREPLIPLVVFRDRNFSLSNLAVAVIGFAVTAMVLPVMFYVQGVCGLSPTRSALLTAPMAISSGLLAPVVGKIVDRSHPRPVIGFGFSVLAIALTWLSIEMTPTTAVRWLVLPFIAMGIGTAFIWSPLVATATRNLPRHLAGAGSGVYNTTTQLGAVLGSASMAAFMTSRISAEMSSVPGRVQHLQAAELQLPEFLREPFAAAMSQSMLLPAFVTLFGVAAALFMVDRTGPVAAPHYGRVDDRTERIPITGDRSDCDHVYDDDDHVYDDDDYVYDDDDYVEITLARDPEIAAFPDQHGGAAPDHSDTEPIAARAQLRDDHHRADADDSAGYGRHSFPKPY
ncbi:MAG: MFS transporter [Mycobacterium sp.]|uniref:MFS transporter n=1 Tax=Mycobacterium sp. TaxID=1785 RepID=UPI00262F87E5|nr:MFS transporter [Mycobacterium sp.]MDI3315499.1 MFS transporter [Mycobacterium sp.]